eukprot:3919491-Rhodomonas_salina.1
MGKLTRLTGGGQMDVVGKVDPYCIAELDGDEQKTTVKKVYLLRISPTHISYAYFQTISHMHICYAYILRISPGHMSGAYLWMCMRISPTHISDAYILHMSEASTRVLREARY